MFLKFIYLLLLFIFSYNSELISSNKDYFNENDKINFPKNNKFLFENNLFSDLIYTLEKIEYLAENNNNKLIKNLQIESNIQYVQDGIFFAEGNVIITTKDMTLKSDYISFDRVNKILIIKDNIEFIKNNQFLRASNIEYDLIKKEGKFYNIYAIVDFVYLNNFIQNNQEENDLQKDNNQDIFLKSDSKRSFKINSQFNDNGGIKTGIDSNNETIDQWRLVADEFTVKQNLIKFPKVFFTNDPINKPQLIIRSENLDIDFSDKKLNFDSKKNTLILDNAISIPLLRKTSNKNIFYNQWEIGYDKDNKDGLFVKRNLKSRKIFKDFEIKGYLEYMLQRSIKNKTKSYPKNHSKVGSPTITTNNNVFDLFGAGLSIDGSISDWNVNLDSALSSFNSDRFPNNFRGDFEINKYIDIYGIKDAELDIFAAYRKDALTINSKKEIVNSLIGFQLSKTISETKNNVEKYSLYGLRGGDYYAKLPNSNSYHGKLKFDLFSTFQNRYSLYKFQNDNNQKIRSRYSPSLIESEIKFLASIQSNLSLYNSEKYPYQGYFYLRSGPEFFYGNADKKILDYSYLSIIGEQIIRTGESPFSFDYYPEYMTRLSLDFEQQIFGPIFAGISSYYYINYPNHINDFDNIQYALFIKRRAYSIEIFYNKSQEEIGLVFDIFNIKSNFREEPFKIKR